MNQSFVEYEREEITAQQDPNFESNEAARERQRRETTVRGVEELVGDIVGDNVEHFTPKNRLEFVGSLNAKGFFDIMKLVNAKLRGEDPEELFNRPEEYHGGTMPGLHSPSKDDKIPAFIRGYDAIQEYLAESDDTVDDKVKMVATASEALIVWTHIFADGNGRTSRFIGKLIEDGAEDVDALAGEVVTSQIKPIHKNKLQTKESSLDDLDLAWELYFRGEDAVMEKQKQAEELPSDIEGMYLSVKRLFESGAIRESVGITV